MKNALLTSIGSVSADISIKSLKRMGIRVIGCDVYPKEWVADAYNVDVFYRAPYVSDTDKYLKFIHGICLQEKIDFVLPLIDLEIDVLNKNRDWFEEHNVCLCMSSEKTLDICRDKKRLAEFIVQNCPSITSIPTVRLSDIEKNPPWSFPLVCKPYNGRSSQGLRYIYNEPEWELFSQTADKDVYIVQPYIEGSIVMVEMVRNAFSEQTIAITRQELLSTPHGCGTTVLMYQDEALENSSMELANMLGIQGSVNFEFIKDTNGKYHFVECNPRFSAGVEFSCLGGYEVIINHMRCFMGEDIDSYVFSHRRYIARKYEEYVTCIDLEEKSNAGN